MHVPDSFSEPHVAATRFRPSRHGFRFANRFALPLPHVPLPHAPQLIRALLPEAPAYGLCGGMAALACDAFLQHVPLPRTSEPPRPGTPLHAALRRRQMDTFGPLPGAEHVRRFAPWSRAPDDAVQRRTARQAHGACRRLARGRPVQLGLVYERRLTRLWHNHQVLAYAAERAAGAFVFRVYEPNHPLRDDVTLRAVRRGGGLLCTQHVGARAARPVRGFFVLAVPTSRRGGGEAGRRPGASR